LNSVSEEREKNTGVMLLSEFPVCESISIGEDIVKIF
jgi:hypothetical protein